MSVHDLDPPRFARILLQASTPAEDRDLVLADLLERYQQVLRKSGGTVARRWYWSQALRALPARLAPDLEWVQRISWSGTAGDVRQGFRALRRRPLYAVGVVGTLGVGLASAAVVASIAWNVWLAPLPFPDPDRVVRLLELEPRDPDVSSTERTAWRLSPPLLEELRAARWETVSAVAGIARNVVDWPREQETMRVTTLTVSPEAFDILGLQPIRGRVLTDDPDATEVVLTRPFWARAFGADPSVVGGETMILGGVPHRVVGVVDLPAGYPGSADVVTPLTFEPEQLVEGMRGARYLDVIARVAPGGTVTGASAEMDRRITALGAHFGNHAGWGGRAVRLSDELLRPYRSVLALLLAAGVVFLLLAVVNVAGLVASRAVEGGDDRSVRLALGASEGRLLRTSVVESVQVGVLAAVGALALAALLMGPVRAMIPVEIPRADQVDLTPAIAASVIVLAMAAGGAVGVVGYLLSRGRGPSLGRRGRAVTDGARGRSAIVVGQVALTTLLAVAGAGILGRVATLQSVDLGFDPDGVVSAQAMLTEERYPTPDARRVVWRELLSGVQGRGLDAAIVTSPPMAGTNMPWGVRRDAAAEQVFAQYHVVSADYFRVMGVELLEGRALDGEDRQGSAPVVVINDVLAAQLFPGEDAVGRPLTVVADTKTIVGVVQATRHFGPDTDAPAEVYAPYTQDPWSHGQIVARGTAERVAPAVAGVAADVAPDLALPPVAPYGRYVAEWFSALRLQLVVVGILAVIGIGLATLGLYALVAYRVNMRRREIGVRMALGASDSRMFSSVVAQGLSLATVGVVVGVGLWHALLPVSERVLGSGDLSHPLASFSVAVLVAVVAAAASAIPARRSVGVDPAVTLRNE